MVVDFVEPEHVETDITVAGEEVRDMSEAVIGIGTVVLVTRAVDPEIIVVHDPFRMGQEHDAGGERAETELVVGKDLASAANGTSAVTDAELRRNDEHAAASLLDTKSLERLCRLGRLPETLGTELAVAAVVELFATGLLYHVDHNLHCLVVGRGDLLPVWDSEPSFCAVGKCFPVYVENVGGFEVRK